MYVVDLIPAPPFPAVSPGRKKKSKETPDLKTGFWKSLGDSRLAGGVSHTRDWHTHRDGSVQHSLELTCVTTVCVCVGGHCWTASDSGQQRAMCALSVYPYVHTYTPDTFSIRFSISFLYLKKGKGRWRARRGEVCLSGLLFVTLLTESLFSKGILSFHFLFWMSIHWWVTTVSSLCLCVLQNAGRLIMQRRLQN